MNNWVALFRGINVGGRHIVPMAELRSMLAAMNCAEVATYIQSGNVVFRHAGRSADRLSGAIAKAVEQRFGFAPNVLLLTHGQLEEAIAGNPFPAATSEPKTLHLYFLAGDSTNSELDGFAEFRAAREEIALRGRVFYLHAPDGIGRSKLAERVEKLLGVSATARNWRTATKTLELAQRLSGS